jgi:hypothetical protein
MVGSGGPEALDEVRAGGFGHESPLARSLNRRIRPGSDHTAAGNGIWRKLRDPGPGTGARDWDPGLAAASKGRGT